MKIAYNSQIFRMQEYGGISRYIVNLARRVAQEEQVVVSASLYINQYLSQLPRGLVRGIKLPWNPQKGARVWEWLGSSIDRMVISNVLPDVVHETYFSYRSVAPPSIPTVITVYDMIHERFSGEFSNEDDTAQRKLATIRRASHVVCISENTRRDLIELTGVDERKVSVVYLGYEMPDATVDKGNKNELKLKHLGPYLLYVGSRNRYKNFRTFIEAYATSSWLQDNFKVVCFGGGAFDKEELELIDSLSIKPGQVLQMGGGDGLLAACYLHAAVFVYPSMYEGFGIPPLEAMSLGCPVVCSNSSSIPEVVGSAGEYFEPQQVESIRSVIEGVLQSTERHTELIRRGYRQCSEFSWDRCASETLNIYRGLVK